MSTENNSQAMEIFPGLIVGGVWMLDDMLKMNPDVLVPLDFLQGWIWKTGFRGEIIYCPITDYSILPDDVLDKLTFTIAERIKNGQRAAVFCVGGHGRTGYVASCVLHLLGVKNPVAFLRENYHRKSVETAEQYEAVKRFIDRHTV